MIYGPFFLRSRIGIEKKIDTKEKFNFIAIHYLSLRCANVCSEKRRPRRKNSHLIILLVLFIGNMKIMALIKIRLYIVFLFNNYIGITFLYASSLKN